MDLLETVLRTANAEQYLELFEREGIQAQSLKLLTNEDLEMIGIDDPTARRAIIKQSENLLFAKEKRIERDVNQEYVKTVLMQIVNQLNLYNATLTCLAYRPDIVNCDLQLNNAALAISTAIKELENEAVNLEQHIYKRKRIPEKSTVTDCIIFKGIILTICLSGLYIVKRILS